MKRRSVWMLLGCGGLLLSADFWMLRIDPFRTGVESQVGFIFGTCFGQIMLCALWLALRTHRFAQRLLEVHFFIAMLLIAMSGSVLQTGSAEELFLVLLIDSTLYLYFLTIFAAIWLIRVGAGIQLVIPLESDKAAAPRTQFEIKHLFIWTATIAVVLGFAKVSIPVASGRSIIIMSWEPVIIFLCLVGFSAIVCLPIAVAMLTDPLRLSWLIASLLLAIFVAGIERPLIAFIPMAQVRPEDQFVFWYINAIQAAWMYGILTLIRASGLRLTRRNG